jgi:Protein of unknown function (DUF1552)
MRKLSRRFFNRQVGAGFLLSPFVSTLIDRPARAQAPGKKAKRLMLFCTMGTAPSIWSPSGGENGFNLPPALAPLSEIKSDVVLIDGLASANPGTGHGFPDALTGKSYIGRIISVDQFAADGLRAAGINRPLPVLLLGADARSGGMSMFNRDQNLFTITSPLAAFNTAFGAAAPPTMSVDGLLKRRRSILDVIRGEIRELNQAVGAQEKAKLELHLDSIRTLENRLGQAANPGGGGGMVAACRPPPRPSDDLSNPLKANLLHLDVLMNAFACDITRVGAVEFGSDEAMQVNLPEIGLRGEQHSGMIHSGPPGLAQLAILEKWFHEQFVAVVKKLKSIPEADGSVTLFDNTLLVWCRDMGDAPAHNRRSMKFVLSGGAGGYLRRNPNGRYLRGAGDGAGDLHERLLLNMLEALGITNFEGFGDTNLRGAGKTPIPGIRA